MYCGQLSDDEVILHFSHKRPFAVNTQGHISVSQLQADVHDLGQKILTQPGDVLLACQSRYIFCAGLLASWSVGRKALLPPNMHPETLRNMHQKHNISMQLDDDFNPTPLSDLSKPEADVVWKFPLKQEAVLIYTSGSTGMPKLVKKNMANVFSEVFTLREVLPLQQSPLVASVPPHHLYGLTFSVLLPWVLDAPVVDECPLHASEVMEVMERLKADTLITVPVHLRAMLEQDNWQAPRQVICSAGALDEHVAQQWYTRFKRHIMEIYGSSETGIIAYRRQLKHKAWKAFSTVDVYEKHGCLRVSSPFIHPSEGVNFQTQDKVTMCEQGFILHGRADSIVKIAGKRLSLLRIEAAIKSCRGIQDAAVVAVPVTSHIRDMALWAAVVCCDHVSISTAELRSMLHSKLDGLEIPRRILWVDSLPRESHGKLRKDRLLALFERKEE